MTDPKTAANDATPPPADDSSIEFAASEADQTAPAPDPLAALEAEKADLKDKLLRTLAEMENLRRRTARDVQDGRAYAITAFARDLLTVADNLSRALDNVPGEAKAAEGPVKALVEGVDLTARELIKTLEKHGVKKLDPVGQKFDPNFHQAMFEAPSEHPAGMVSTVVQSGYAIGERVLRPAMVGVSKGPAKTAVNGGAQ